MFPRSYWPAAECTTTLVREAHAKCRVGTELAFVGVAFLQRLLNVLEYTAAAVIRRKETPMEAPTVARLLSALVLVPLLAQSQVIPQLPVQQVLRPSAEDSDNLRANNFGEAMTLTGTHLLSAWAKAPTPALSRFSPAARMACGPALPP